MAQFLRQVLVQDESLAVSTTRTDDLPVNPLSMILLTVRNLNNTADLDNFSNIVALLDQISKVEILFQGSAIISGSLADLARLFGLMLNHPPMQTASSVVDNDSRSLTIPLLLGRKPYWMQECFPAVRRGELQLQITSAAAQTGIDNLVVQVETVELLGATPGRYLKATTISKTPSATGDHDVDLPIGNKLAGALLFGTSVPTGASFNASFGQLRLLLDNVEAYYAKCNWESLHGELSRKIREGVSAGTYRSRENDAVAYTQDALIDGEHAQVGFWNQYALLDFDPHGDDSYLLDTKGRARIHLRINADVADAIRIIPIELVDIAGGAA
jgi:hypothetical protein